MNAPPLNPFSPAGMGSAIRWPSPGDEWTHQLTPEGHLWRWTATWRRGQTGEAVNDLGLVNGGIFVAVAALLLTSGYRAQEGEERR